MDNFSKIKLEMKNGKYIHLNADYLKPFEDDLLHLIDDEDFMKTLSFAKRMMMGSEIKSNNAIEGIIDDISLIEDVIKRRKKPLSEEERKRIINLYHGYQYILNHKSINKDSLKELYSILSKGLLTENYINNMGDYYRNKPVIIYKHYVDNPYTGMDASKLDYYMNQFFTYVNSSLNSNSEIDIFIKSQIMHFYFVYVHPYFDVNGRTSRTISMWYLLNNKAYPYIIFNRAISFARREYDESIIKGREGDITLFLKYMLIEVTKELEKEYVLHNIKTSLNITLSREDTQMIDYLLSMKSNLTAKDLATLYNNYNKHRRTSEIFEERIIPLLDKKVLINLGETKGFIKKDTPNIKITINSDALDVNFEKIKYLNLKRFINK